MAFPKGSAQLQTHTQMQGLNWVQEDADGHCVIKGDTGQSHGVKNSVSVEKQYVHRQQAVCPDVGDMWMKLDDDRETAQARRAKHSEKKWSEHMRALAPLKVGDTVMLQNQSGDQPLRWDKRGTVMNCEGFD